MLRSILSVSSSLARPAFLRKPQFSAISTRLNSTLNAQHEHPQQPQEQLITEHPQPTEEEEAAAWLDAVKELRKRYKTEGVPNFSSAKMEQFDKNKFEPTEEQLLKFQSLEGKPIPSKKDSVVDHCTNMIMKDGKKAAAQRYMNRALYLVRLQLRKDPVEVLKTVLDEMAPLMQLKTYKTRVAKNLVVPVPLTKRQRDRRAFLWILEGSEKRRSKDFAVRLGEEIIAASEGKSSGYEKRLQMHKAAMLHRSYIKLT